MRLVNKTASELKTGDQIVVGGYIYYVNKISKMVNEDFSQQWQVHFGLKSSLSCKEYDQLTIVVKS